MYLLDTNVISELRHGKAGASPAVLAWAASKPISAHYLSAITVLEMDYGVKRLRAMTPPQGQQLTAWVTRVLDAFEGRVLAFDLTVARRCASLHVTGTLADRDTMIAATALVHRMTVVTRNVRHFEGSGVPIYDPWTFDPANPGSTP
ncbi:MAG: type II toxin-antitoxin system VapC family toxin [Lautropia sp.]